ncbi:hypothetical protein VTJ49DRAFT_3730 [Mycothermus thermophilus]|uniref:Uncharacterized protein n=1 Tax=Humicola insolens TaxID=85995 RepID=A0ABR3V6W5_HUMIN
MMVRLGSDAGDDGRRHSGLDEALHGDVACRCNQTSGRVREVWRSHRIRQGLRRFAVCRLFQRNVVESPKETLCWMESRLSSQKERATCGRCKRATRRFKREMNRKEKTTGFELMKDRNGREGQEGEEKERNEHLAGVFGPDFAKARTLDQDDELGEIASLAQGIHTVAANERRRLLQVPPR